MKWEPGGDNLVKDVQYYELFGGIALQNHALKKNNNLDILEDHPVCKFIISLEMRYQLISEIEKKDIGKS